MSKKLDARVSNYTVLENGVIRIARQFANVLEPYEKDSIPDYLALVDHSLAIPDKKEYKRALRKLEEELNLLIRQLADKGKALIVALQGRDGAGKTGAVKRIEEALGNDFKLFLSVPVGPPNQEELQHSYLWRFFRHNYMPAVGQVRVFDRCWAERVLVERVMELTAKDKIRSSYAELRAFEWMLHSQGMVLVKIWLDIDKAEQKRRFKEREKKPWKISASDSVARKHWDDYTPAANELFHRTGTDFAPWNIISSQDKRYSRITVLETIVAALRAALAAE